MSIYRKSSVSRTRTKSRAISIFRTTKVRFVESELSLQGQKRKFRGDERDTWGEGREKF
jgi:hypothetical protein